MLLSDNGLEDETPESDAHDLTEADRTIFIGISWSGDGEVVFVIPMVSEGHDDADETTGDMGEIVDVVPLAMGYDRQRVGEEDEWLVAFAGSTDEDWESSDFFSSCVVGETGNDVEHLLSSLAVEFDGSAGEVARGDGNVPLSRAGKMLVKVLVADRCDDDGGKSPLRRIEEMLSDDELDEGEGTEGADDWSIWVRNVFSAVELRLSFPREGADDARDIPSVPYLRRLTIVLMIQL